MTSERTDVEKIPTPNDEDRYSLEETVGNAGTVGIGGFGTVYAFKDRWMNRRVAVKKRKENVDADDGISADEMQLRFKNEARILSLVNHPNVVTVYESRHDKIIMEFLNGPTLAQYVRRNAMVLDDALRVAVELLRVISFLHKEGIVHRDISPHNVVLHMPGEMVRFGAEARLDSSTVVKIIDFGISTVSGSSLTATTSVPAKSRQFGAPEDNPKRAGDLYQIGVLMIFMLAGRSPDSKVPCPDDWSRSLDELKHVPYSVRRVLRRAIQRDENLRHQSAEGFLEALRRAQYFRQIARFATASFVALVAVVAWYATSGRDSTGATSGAPTGGSTAAVVDPRSKSEESRAGDPGADPIVYEPNRPFGECPKIVSEAVIQSWKAAVDHLVDGEPRPALEELNKIIDRQSLKDKEVSDCSAFRRLRAEALLMLARGEESDRGALEHLVAAMHDMDEIFSGLRSKIKREIEVRNGRISESQPAPITPTPGEPSADPLLVSLTPMGPPAGPVRGPSPRPPGKRSNHNKPAATGLSSPTEERDGPNGGEHGGGQEAKKPGSPI